jgi:hypothetical protein
MKPKRPIQKTHLTATAPNGDALAVVSYADGRVAITRNEQPIPEMEWDAGEMAECTAMFAKLMGISGTGD